MMKKIIYGIIFTILICLVSFYIYKTHNGYVMEDIIIKNDDNQKIYGQLYKPRTNKKMPIIIYSHGLGATYRAGIDYGKKFTEYGIATFTYDFRGGSSRSKSEGETTEMSFLTEMDDLELVIETVKKWSFVDPNNIILMGSSQGGAISALVSSSHPNDIKGTILLYPALSIPTVVHNWYSSTEDIPNEVEMTDNITVGPRYFIDIWNMDVYSMIEQDNKKILIIQGSDDKLVSVDHSKKVNDIYPNSKLKIINGAGHGFDGKEFDEAVEYILDYFKELNIIK